MRLQRTAYGHSELRGFQAEVFMPGWRKSAEQAHQKPEGNRDQNDPRGHLQTEHHFAESHLVAHASGEAVERQHQKNSENGP